jgi:hypothetical protein
LIALGLGPTVVCALGVGAIWKRMPTTTIGVVLMTSALVGVATPLFQTVRQPFRSSMKASFALSALSALAVFFAAGYAWLSRRRGGPVWRALVLVNVAWLAVAVVWHFLDLALVFPHCAEYVARRDRL